MYNIYSLFSNFFNNFYLLQFLLQVLLGHLFLIVDIQVEGGLPCRRLQISNTYFIAFSAGVSSALLFCQAI